MKSPKLAEEASMLERELRDIGSHEKVQYKRQVIMQAARLLKDILNEDEDEPHNEPSDEY